ncbi:MAG TPA: GTP cyclohydrolase II [Stellaceae bacterium]|nr:GTP cyclohydrolase II [Stellaceae bacterium]
MAERPSTSSTPQPAGPAGSRALDGAIVAFRRGDAVLLCSDNGAVLAVAAELVTEESLARLRAMSSRRLSVVVTRRRAVALGLAPRADLSGAVRITVAANLSAAVIRKLADPAASLGAEPPGLGPGPVTPEPGALAAVTLAKLADLLPAALVLWLVPAEAALARRRADFSVVDMTAVLNRRAALAALERVAEARVPLAKAEDARLVAFRPGDGGIEHLAILIGRPDPANGVLVRLHSECFTGDVLASLRCDCGEQLQGAIATIAEAGGGVLLYLAQEGRGIGLVNKLRAYQLQDAGFDTIDANEQLGFDADERVYQPAAEMLRQLGFAAVRLLTNNPDKVAALQRYGISVVERVPHVFPANGHNERYLATKATRSGHFL